MTKLDFGPVMLGGNVFGWTVKTREEAFTLLDAFVEGGGKSIDTADSYVAFAPGCQGGESETMIGEWLAARKNRASLVIATKVGRWAKRPGLSPKNIRESIDGSLKRLQTDYVDLYYAHADDENVAQPEYVSAFDDLVRVGKVRALGASNFTAPRLGAALEFAKNFGLHAFEYSQDKWNLVEREVEQRLVPTLIEAGLQELPYYSLASGFLTGKYRPGTAVDSARVQNAGKYLAEPNNVKLLSVLDGIAAEHQVSVAAVSLAWLKSHAVVAAPLASARTVEQLAPMFEAASLKLNADELGALSA